MLRKISETQANITVFNNPKHIKQNNSFILKINAIINQDYFKN